MTWGSVENSGGACVFCIVVKGGLRPPYRYGTKYTGPPRVFDTPSSHSNFNPNSNSNFNSKLKNKTIFFCHRRYFVGEFTTIIPSGNFEGPKGRAMHTTTGVIRDIKCWRTDATWSESPESIPVFGLSLWKKKLFYFLVWNWNWNWNWNWDWSWNDLRECQKLWGGLCILHRPYTGAKPPL